VDKHKEKIDLSIASSYFIRNFVQRTGNRGKGLRCWPCLRTAWTG